VADRDPPDKVRCDYLVNEGGGGIIDYDAGGCTASAAPRRASSASPCTPRRRRACRDAQLGDNALLKLAPIIERFSGRQPSYRLTAEPRAFLEAIGALEGDDAAAALERVRAIEPRLVALVEPMLGVSLAPTRSSPPTRST